MYQKRFIAIHTDYVLWLYALVIVTERVVLPLLYLANSYKRLIGTDRLCFARSGTPADRAA